MSTFTYKAFSETVLGFVAKVSETRFVKLGSLTIKLPSTSIQLNDVAPLTGLCPLLSHVRSLRHREQEKEENEVKRARYWRTGCTTDLRCLPSNIKYRTILPGSPE